MSLRFEQKGSGGIVFVSSKAVKASSIDHQFSMAKLCKRLGEFIPGDYAAPMSKIEPEPVSKIAEEQGREYRNTRLRETERRKFQKSGTPETERGGDGRIQGSAKGKA